MFNDEDDTNDTKKKEEEKAQPRALPACQLSGTDGNVYTIIGTVCKCLKKAGLAEKASEFKTRAMNSESYDDVLVLCHEFVDVQ